MFDEESFVDSDPRLHGLASDVEGSSAPADAIAVSFVARRRLALLLDTAAHLYPYMSAQFPTPEEAGAMKIGGDVTEIDVVRGLRAVTLAFGMEAAIRARLNRERADALLARTQ